MPSDWNDADRRAIRIVGVWFGVLLGSMVVTGVIAKAGDSQPILALSLSAAWIVGAISAVIWTLRQRKRTK